MFSSFERGILKGETGRERRNRKGRQIGQKRGKGEELPESVRFIDSRTYPIGSFHHGLYNIWKRPWANRQSSGTSAPQAQALKNPRWLR